MSNFNSETNSSQTSTDTVPFNKNGQQNIESGERMRRLIPYMTFYIPTSNRDYLHTSPYGPINSKPMVIYSCNLQCMNALHATISNNNQIENLERNF